MTSAPLLIIIDDKRTDLMSYGPKDWKTSTLTPWFNGTEQAPAFASNGSGQFGTIVMNFEGTAVAFFGTTPQAFNGSQILTVSIDGSQPTNTSYNDPNPPSYRQWYQSPTLSEGSHNISLSHIAGTSLDFAVVTVGDNTPLAGQVAIVDNEDPSIAFEGNWTQSEASFTSGEFPDGLPFHNSTQDSTTIGDSLTFSFTGQSAAIYGIFTWSNLGLITLTFTMDGSPLSQTFQVTSTTSQFQSHLGQQQNFQFFSYDFLPPGNHTLIVNVTDCVNQTFSFDYITFQPSFSTLATRPNLTSFTDTAFTSSSHSHLSAGAIAGIIVTVLLAALGGVLFLRRRRRKTKPKHKLHNLINPFLPARPDAESFPLNGPDLSSSAPVMSNDRSSHRYSPVHIDGDAQVAAAAEPITSFVSADSYNLSQHLDPFTSGAFYDQHEDNMTAEGTELLPSYDESTRLASTGSSIPNLR